MRSCRPDQVALVESAKYKKTKRLRDSFQYSRDLPEGTSTPLLERSTGMTHYLFVAEIPAVSGITIRPMELTRPAWVPYEPLKVAA